MKVQTAIRTSVALLLTLSLLTANAQSVTASYPDQWAIITKQGGEVTSQATTNTVKMGAIVAEQHIAAQMLTQLEKWNAEYNDYLKDPTGLAGSIRLGSTLYTQGAILLENIYLLKKTIDANPEGIAASVPMNNLYMETATTAVKCYKTLKRAITKGGSDNMLNGAERVELLWQLSADMHELNKKVRKTAISIAYYRLQDIWYKATEGMIDYNHDEIARRCLDDWKRAYQASKIFE